MGLIFLDGYPSTFHLGGAEPPSEVRSGESGVCRRQRQTNQGICGWFAGGAVVPGRALIDTLPLVRHVVVSPAVWQFGSASATGAETITATATLAINMANLL
jgi:hypothetical protein